MPHQPPPCTAVGRQCRGLQVTLRVAHYDGPATSVDHEATWLLGHTEHIHFGDLSRRGGSLYAKAFLAVPCRYAVAEGPNTLCSAHGHRGAVQPETRQPVSRRRPDGTFQYVHKGRLVEGNLEEKPAAPGSLPILGGPNPCATARCRTADNAVGAACCRDLQIEIICRRANKRLEALIRSRRPPYLCKIEREEPDSLAAEVISACSYLGDDGIHCSLHNRRRADGRGAKPDLCFSWPDTEVFHTGCVFKPAGTP